MRERRSRGAETATGAQEIHIKCSIVDIYINVCMCICISLSIYASISLYPYRSLRVYTHHSRIRTLAMCARVGYVYSNRLRVYM